MEGHYHFLAQRDEAALDAFDMALDCGFEHPELFEKQATCFQRSGYDFDAIEAFGRVLESQRQDCNLYFMRSLSLTAVCRYSEAADDLRDAIRLSKVNNSRNEGYHASAQLTGWASATAIYEHYLIVNELYLKKSDEVQELRRRGLQIKRRIPKA